ncbi:hypothetical protein JOQ06_015781 [Pogonophryne albipinna]|uniref:Death domain-associated protein 6 n=1 Tax=Pogonophryne albipinna TaxID=1090488 RepID=A0AAD6AMA3_9TELE|nr:hypothetical protein JOQ06_015510 [Pogonophryne albipinna]KAJ4927981.1 hypothetical protein JOQ06_015781 [Pogonophryne albipinna]
MAVAPALMADKIIVLDDDDDEEDIPQPSCSASTSSYQLKAKLISPLRAPQPAPTHITQSPFASAKKNPQVLQATNQKLFTEFVEHCTVLTQDCPEVLTFLQTKHAKASADYLSSVEFRNTLGRCLTRAQANRSKAFVYISELCTALKQNAAKRRLILSKVGPRPSTSTSSSFLSSSFMLKNEDETKVKMDEEDGGVNPAAEDKEPSTSGLQEDQEAEKKTKRASRKQIAYLENLLKLYNDEICRLQQAELSVDDLGKEGSSYIQEHKLKRKMMKIYEKLCELKSCNTLTGRVMEQRISYKSTRYPEINRRIERFINGPEAQRNPPDYHDILQQVLRANERHNLCLTRKLLNQIAQEAFRETGSRMQERRHLDLVYNFGSRITDTYKPASDPALSDTSLLRKLRSNREMAMSRLDEVITKFAVKQDDTEEQERAKRLEKDGKDKKANKSENGEAEKEVNDTDIEEEIQASTQQAGDDDEEEDGNEAEPACDAADKEDQTDQLAGSVSRDKEGNAKEDDDETPSGLSPLSEDSGSQVSPLSDLPSSRQSPSQSEPMKTEEKTPLSNGVPSALEEPADSSNHVSAVPVSTSKGTADVFSAAANGGTVPLSPVVIVENGNTQTNGTSPPPSIRATRSQKRKMEEMIPENSRNSKHILIHDSSPQCAESTRASTPTQEIVSSSQFTPPPKKNKVNVATQCDPDEVIILSDSE